MFHALPLFTLLLHLLASSFAIPTGLHQISRYQGEKTNNLVITLKSGTSRAQVLKKLGRNVSVTYEWDSAFNGFSGRFDEAAVDILREHQDVESIEEDGIFHATGLKTQQNAPWGLGRLSAERIQNQGYAATCYFYTYQDPAAKGVDIYFLDTGIRITHSQFGGRAQFAAVYGGYQAVDGHGHGTHTAAIAAGSQYGVAKAATVYAVRVLNDTGSGTVTDIVSGLNFVIQAAHSSGKPTVIGLPIAGGVSAALDNAVISATNAGIHVVVASGNQNVDAWNISPARVSTAITVGSSNIADERVSTSNYGTVVNTHSPGQNIVSAWATSDTATAIVSGTSASSAFVVGIVAYYIGLFGQKSPADMQKMVEDESLVRYLTNISSGTPNRLSTNMHICPQRGIQVCI